MAKNKIERILIAVRPWEGHLPVSARHACFLADRLGAQVTLISCISESQLAFGLAWAEPAAVTALQSEWFQREEQTLNELAQPLRDAGISVTTHVSSHTPVFAGILEQVENLEADLLIVGVHEPKPVPHTRLTDIDWQLMRLCPCPLLLVRDPNGESYRRLLATVDPLHRHAEPAGLDRAVLNTAVQLGRAFDAELTVANVYPDPDDYEFASSIEVAPGVFYGTENIVEAHHEAVAALLNEHGIAHDQAVLRPGEPAAVISELAAEYRTDLIVLGAVKRSRWQAAVLGSTAEAVVADAPCDVLLVKPPNT